MTRAERLRSELHLTRAALRSRTAALAAVFPDGQPVKLAGGRGGVVLARGYGSDGELVKLAGGRGGVVLARGYGSDGELVKVGTGDTGYTLVGAEELLRLNPHLGAEPAEGRE